MKTVVQRMKARRLFGPLLGVAAAIGLAVALLSPGVAQVAPVDPPMVDVILAPGESHHVVKTVEVPAVPPKLDFCLLVDLSGSYGNDIVNIRNLDAGIFDSVRATVADSLFCSASFVDYPIANYGSAGSGDYAYQLEQDLTTTKATWTTSIDNMVVRFGADGPESQYTGLHQISTGTGVDVTGNCPAFAAANVAAGQDPTWRAGASRVVAITTDAPFHNPGDASANCPAGGYPGPSSAATITELAIENIKVIAIKAPGSGAQMDAIAAATGGSVVTTGSSSAEIADAIVAGLAALTFDITAMPVGCDPLVITFMPDVHEDVAGPTTVEFEEWIEVPVGTPPGEVHCTVEFKADGAVIGVQEIWVTIRAPLFLIIDEETIDNGTSTIEAIAGAPLFCGSPAGGPADEDGPGVCINDDIASNGAGRSPACDPNNPMILFSRPAPPRAISGLRLPTGEFAGTSGDEGLFSPINPSAAFLNDYLDGCIPQSALDPVPGFPLHNLEIEALEGRTVCAMVHDSNVSHLEGNQLNLQGNRLGLTAFEVTDVLPPPAGLPEAGSSSSLPVIEVDIINDPDQVLAICEGPFEFLPEPPPDADNDQDGFSDALELAIGTNPVRACSIGLVPPTDAWPPDPGGNCIVGIDDVFFAASQFGGSAARAEIASQDGTVGIDDVFAFAARFGQTSTSP